MNNIIIQGEEERKRNIHYEVDPAMPPLGEGGTGIVRLGYIVNELTGQKQIVAVKFLYDDVSIDTVERSRREAAIKISCENIIRMISFVQIEEKTNTGTKEIRSHVVSELLHGVVLSDLLDGNVANGHGSQYAGVVNAQQQYKTNRVAFAVNVIRQVLSAIQALHDYGYIHRDIDPSNIMITEDGCIKLIDLGIAKKIDDLRSDEHKLTKDGTFVGKAHYAAPELALGDLAHQNKVTDIYAIGVLLYQIVVGKLPFEGSIYEVLNMQCHKPFPSDDINHKAIRRIVKKATSKKPSDRYQSAAEFRVALDAVSVDNASQTAGRNKKSLIIAGLIVAFIIVTTLIICCIRSCNEDADEIDTSVAVEQNDTNNKDAVNESSKPVSDTAKQTNSDPSVTAVKRQENKTIPENKNKTESRSQAKEVKESPQSPKETNGGSVGYGHFSGNIKNGKPNGIGKLTFSSSHLIDSRDSQGRVAEPGDYVNGEWSEGRLIQGRWYDSAGNSKGLIIIGR